MRLIHIGLLAIVVVASGCSINDNPTDSNKMSEIRHKEAADRANFNPSMTPAPHK